MSSAIRYAICFAIGALAGPILIALGLSLVSVNMTGEPNETSKTFEAGQLIDAYRARLPRGILFRTIIPPPDGKECGYDPEAVFPGRIGVMGMAHQESGWADYAGYYALNNWRRKSRDDAWISDITNKIAEDMSLPRLKFLRMCIEGTVFSRACMAEVEKYGDRVERFKKGRKSPFNFAGGEEDRVVCTYVDGVAARRGLPLSPAIDQKLADRYDLGGN